MRVQPFVFRNKSQICEFVILLVTLHYSKKRNNEDFISHISMYLYGANDSCFDCVGRNINRYWLNVGRWSLVGLLSGNDVG